MKITGSWQIGISLAAVLALHGESGLAAESRFEIDLKELPKAAAPPARSVQAPRAAAPPASSPARIKATDGLHHYTVKPGDHIFKILMRDFGLSNQQAEQLMPDIARLNGISDIRRLRVGQKLQIPLTPSSRSGRKSDPKAAARKEPSPQPPPSEPLAVEEQPAAVAVAPPTPPDPATATPAVPVQPAQTQAQEPKAVPSPLLPTPSPLPSRSERVIISPVTAKDKDGIVDAVLDLLAPGWVRHRIVEAGKESTDGSYVSIKVDRYFEHLGYRYIVNSENDPLTLTLLRLLEVQGDRVINVGRDDGATVIAARIATKMELPQQGGTFRVRCLDVNGGDVEVRGIRISPAGPYEKELIITGEQAPACTAELLTGAETPLVVK